MAIATSLYFASQLHSETFPRQLFTGACVTRKTLPCLTLKSSLLPPFAVAAASSSVQAEPRTTAIRRRFYLFALAMALISIDWSLGILSSSAVSIFLMIEDAKLTPMVISCCVVLLMRFWGHGSSRYRTDLSRDRS